MKNEPKPISIDRDSVFQLDPSLKSDEAIVLRALAAGQTDTQECKELHLDPTTFLRMMRVMREKIGTKDNVSLIEWAKCKVKCVDQRIDSPRKSARIG
jgi:hypothetical protein